MENLNDMNQHEINNLMKTYELFEWEAELERKVKAINKMRKEERQELEAADFKKRANMAKIMNMIGYTLLAIVMFFIAGAILDGNQKLVTLLTISLAAGILITAKALPKAKAEPEENDEDLDNVTMV